MASEEPKLVLDYATAEAQRSLVVPNTIVLAIGMFAAGAVAIGPQDGRGLSVTFATGAAYWPTIAILASSDRVCRWRAATMSFDYEPWAGVLFAVAALLNPLMILARDEYFFSRPATGAGVVLAMAAVGPLIGLLWGAWSDKATRVVLVLATLLLTSCVVQVQECPHTRQVRVWGVVIWKEGKQCYNTKVWRCWPFYFLDR
ncbi:MAG: hypothetical protein QM770_15005 [Tepidisphaeraceae bacterium]